VSIVSATIYRRRAEEYRTLAAKVSDDQQRHGLMSVCALLESLADAATEQPDHNQKTRQIDASVRGVALIETARRAVVSQSRLAAANAEKSE
jgi:hypothetical protein